VRRTIALLVIVIAIVGSLAIRYRWKWARPLVRRWERIHPYVLAYVRLAPATFVYLFVITVTTWVLRNSPFLVRHALLSEHSTNLHQLAIDPVTVLVTSAFWVTPVELIFWAALFPLVLAPAERWLGSLRTIVVFAIGHVGATVITAAALAYAINHGDAPEHLRNVVDVGSSYGFFCVAALFSYRLPRPWSWIVAAGLVVGTGTVAAVHGTFTDYGHLTSVLIGLALYVMTTAHAVRHRDHWPIWRPPEPMVEAEREQIAARDAIVRGVST
jgi:hypothetical protein